MLLKELKKLGKVHGIPQAYKMRKADLEDALFKAGVRALPDSCDLPKSTCPGDYTRDELVSIAKSCRIKGIAKKSDSELCSSIIKLLKRTGEVWEQEGKNMVRSYPAYVFMSGDDTHSLVENFHFNIEKCVHFRKNLLKSLKSSHFEDFVDKKDVEKIKALEFDIKIKNLTNPKKEIVVGDNCEDIEKFMKASPEDLFGIIIHTHKDEIVEEDDEIVEEDDEIVEEDDEIVEEDEKIPNHGYWPIHEDEFKTCTVFSKCDKDYTKSELIELAIKCGVETDRQVLKYTEKSKICNKLKKKYGTKPKPLYKKQFRKDVVSGIDLGKYRSIKSIPREKMVSLKALGFRVPVKSRKCKNDTDIMMEETEKIPEEVYIKTSAGFCYDVNDLVNYMTIMMDSNTDPINSSKPIWKDRNDKNKILNHKGLEPALLVSYEAMKERLRVQTTEKCKLLIQKKDIFTQIGNTGFVCISDNPSAQEDDEEDFNVAQKALEDLYEILKSQLDFDEWKELSAGTIKLGQVLKDIANTCIHGTGFKLAYIFAYWQTKLFVETGEMIKSKLYTPLVDCGYTLSFHINEDSLEDLPLQSKKSKVKELAYRVCVFKTDLEMPNTVFYFGRGRIGVNLTKKGFENRKYSSDLYQLEKLTCWAELKKNAKNIWKTYTQGLYEIVDKYVK